MISVLAERKRANKAKQNKEVCFLIFFEDRLVILNRIVNVMVMAGMMMALAKEGVEVD
jgi:hypothetical protein